MIARVETEPRNGDSSYSVMSLYSQGDDGREVESKVGQSSEAQRRKAQQGLSYWIFELQVWFMLW